MARAAAWIAGPIQYWRGTHANFDLAWDFIGATSDRKILRWRLRYKADERRFFSGTLQSDSADQEHFGKLWEVFRHAAVSRRDLPKGAIVNALRGMLPAEEIVAATRLSIGRKT